MPGQCEALSKAATQRGAFTAGNKVKETDWISKTTVTGRSTAELAGEGHSIQQQSARWGGVGGWVEEAALCTVVD